MRITHFNYFIINIHFTINKYSVFHSDKKSKKQTAMQQPIITPYAQRRK